MLDCFFKKASNKDGLNQKCKECFNELQNKYKDKIKAYQTKYGQENKERLTKYKQEWQKRKGIDRTQYFARYRKENHSIIRRRSIERFKRPDVKEKYRQYLLKYRTKKKNLPATLTAEDWVECLEFFGYKDAYTGKPMDNVSRDHVIPLSIGGSYTRRNIIPCENSINKSKNNSDMETWYRKQPFFSEERLKKIYKWIGYNSETKSQQITLY